MNRINARAGRVAKFNILLWVCFILFLFAGFLGFFAILEAKVTYVWDTEFETMGALEGAGIGLIDGVGSSKPKNPKASVGPQANIGTGGGKEVATTTDNIYAASSAVASSTVSADSSTTVSPPPNTSSATQDTYVSQSVATTSSASVNYGNGATTTQIVATTTDASLANQDTFIDEPEDVYTNTYTASTSASQTATSTTSSQATASTASISSGNAQSATSTQTGETTGSSTSQSSVGSTSTSSSQHSSESIDLGISTNSTSSSSASSSASASSTAVTTSNPSLATSTAATSTNSASSATSSASAYWGIRSVSSMKETKDKICNQDDKPFIEGWVSKAAELGVNYIAVETPYDDPPCGSSVAYTKDWTDAIRAKGLSVWHRHAPLQFEGIYSQSKDSSKDYLKLIADYIKANPSFFKEGDIFTPIPEPQNGGIRGVTYCPQDICMFSGATSFNSWLRDAIAASEAAFSSIGLGGKIKIGYYGFDGFVAWGDNNPDWNGILEDATIAAMRNITIDHYPEIVGDTMENDLNELMGLYPNIPIVIGEWGTITGGDTTAAVSASMRAAIRPNVIGFNYWHMGLGGNESLLDDGLVERSTFEAVKGFFKRE